MRGTLAKQIKRAVGLPRRVPLELREYEGVSHTERTHKIRNHQGQVVYTYDTITMRNTVHSPRRMYQRVKARMLNVKRA